MPITLPEKLDTLDDLDPKLKPLYVPGEGGAGFVFKDVAGLQSAHVKVKEQLQASTAQIATLSEQLKSWEGFKAEEVKALMAQKAEIEAAKGNLPAEIQNIKTQLQQSYEGKLSAANKQASDLKALIEQGVRGDAVKSALVAANARQDRIDQLTALITPRIAVVWDPTTGKPRPAILKSDGMPELNPETAEEMKPADVVAKFRKDLPEWFQAGAGSGAGSGGGHVAAPTDGDPRKWTPQQLDAYAKQHGEAALQQLITNAARSSKAA